MSVRNPFFYRAFFLLVLAELFSIFGYLLPSFNTIGFFVITALVLAVTLWKFEYGIYCVFAELVVGSKGFLFFWTIAHTTVSIRIAFWLIVMSVWIAYFLFSAEERRNVICRVREPLVRWLLAFFAIIFFATVRGFSRNDFADVFLDANAWLFFLLLFPLLAKIRSVHLEHILLILFAGTLLTSLKAFAALFIYAHDPLGGVFLPLYYWIRISGVGEITAITPTFVRVFFQSQIYTLIAFFILLVRIIPSHSPFYKGEKEGVTKYVMCYVLCVMYLASILLSFSRSFWVSGIVTFVALVIGECVQKISVRSLLMRIGTLLSLMMASVVLVWLVMNFPYPRTAGGSFANLLEDRATVTQESGVGSRWSLLPPLLRRIVEHPFIGSGFGATVTYRSSDPRIVESSARGNNFYTTYAFEWGYLDLLFKFGLIGSFFLCIALWRIGMGLYRLQEYGWFLGFIALLMTNVFSPYVNHPLGIGYLLLCTAVYFARAPASGEASSALS